MQTNKIVFTAFFITLAIQTISIMAIQILPNSPSFGGRIGEGLGTGIATGLQALAQQKSQQLQREQEAVLQQALLTLVHKQELERMAYQYHLQKEAYQRQLEVLKELEQKAENQKKIMEQCAHHEHRNNIILLFISALIILLIWAAVKHKKLIMKLLGSLFILACISPVENTYAYPRKSLYSSKARKSYTKKASYDGFGKVSKANGLIKAKSVHGHFKPSNGYKFVNPYARSK